MATKARKFHSRYSYVSFRTHPGTDHACQYLAGEDVGELRAQIFIRDKGKCFQCGAWYGPQYGHMHHIRHKDKYERCSCEENLTWSCPKCHRALHVRVQWSAERQSTASEQ